MLDHRFKIFLETATEYSSLTYNKHMACVGELRLGFLRDTHELRPTHLREREREVGERERETTWLTLADLCVCVCQPLLSRSGPSHDSELWSNRTDTKYSDCLYVWQVVWFDQLGSGSQPQHAHGKLRAHLPPFPSTEQFLGQHEARNVTQISYRCTPVAGQHEARNVTLISYRCISVAGQHEARNVTQTSYRCTPVNMKLGMLLRHLTGVLLLQVNMKLGMFPQDRAVLKRDGLALFSRLIRTKNVESMQGEAKPSGPEVAGGSKKLKLKMILHGLQDPVPWVQVVALKYKY
uniref:Uncharacterized protein n=1 Tax=Timema monikensis TaxID=170555 RepID=A0A7R9E8J0_9NEOP|nr:unnamed protein product [Timema monikensis]